MLEKKVLDYIDAHEQEAQELLLTLAQIPAPSHHEEKRAEFCKGWLESQGAKGVYIDEALNVVYPIGVTEDNPLVVFMAHTDVVFPDTDPLPLTIQDGKICCPGVGDDTANLVNLLMVAKYLAENPAEYASESHGLLLVCNSCEEGLGNLKGSKKICEDFGSRIQAFYSFDGRMDGIVDRAVGSKRFKITIRTIGGHSYGSFGNPNAIVQMSGMIQRLYQIAVPEHGRTTYNVGLISGGTSVNTIAQQAEMMYEFRSECRENLDYMDAQFEKVLGDCREQGWDIEVEVVGLRPCEGNVDKETRERMLRDAAGIIKEHTGKMPEFHSGSTDCNIPLSMGISSVCLGTIYGAGAHTREEYVLIDSLMPGHKVAFQMILGYCR